MESISSYTLAQKAVASKRTLGGLRKDQEVKDHRSGQLLASNSKVQPRPSSTLILVEKLQQVGKLKLTVA